MVVVGSVLLLADLGNRNRDRSQSRSTIANVISSEDIISEYIKIALIQFVNAPFSEDSENGIKDGLETLCL